MQNIYCNSAGISIVSVQYLEYHHPLLTAALHRLLQYLVVVSNPAPAASVWPSCTVLYSAVLYVYHVLYTRTTFRYFDTFTGLYISQFGVSLCIHRSKQLSMFVKIFINNLRDDVLSMTTFVQCSVSLYLILGDISYSKSEYWSG